jgi:molybdenum cofactor guanylyltransferase
MGDAATRAGFLLAGGRSSRMGRDKALLPFDGRTFAEHIAEKIRRVAGSVSLIGPQEKYPLPGFADLLPGNGPLGGVFTALDRTRADWNLIVACDMPYVTVDLFEALFHAAESAGSDGALAGHAGHIEPLCAVYHRRCRASALAAIHRKSLKMHDFVSSLEMSIVDFKDPGAFANINTLEEWSLR